jgi:hypothetical protein
MRNAPRASAVSPCIAVYGPDNASGAIAFVGTSLQPGFVPAKSSLTRHGVLGNNEPLAKRSNVEEDAVDRIVAAARASAARGLEAVNVQQIASSAAVSAKLDHHFAAGARNCQ